jgi:hypothetical protein
VLELSHVDQAIREPYEPRRMLQYVMLKRREEMEGRKPQSILLKSRVCEQEEVLGLVVEYFLD